MFIGSVKINYIIKILTFYDLNNKDIKISILIIENVPNVYLLVYCSHVGSLTLGTYAVKGSLKFLC